jgi:hypothetical protein
VLAPLPLTALAPTLVWSRSYVHGSGGLKTRGASWSGDGVAMAVCDEPAASVVALLAGVAPPPAGDARTLAGVAPPSAGVAPPPTGDAPTPAGVAPPSAGDAPTPAGVAPPPAGDTPTPVGVAPPPMVAPSVPNCDG